MVGKWHSAIDTQNDFRKGSKQAGTNPASVSFPNTGGADVSIRTLESRPEIQRNPRPRHQRISQAAGIGNSTFIIDAKPGLRELSPLRKPAKLTP
jgi:hypothetical protein